MVGVDGSGQTKCLGESETGMYWYLDGTISVEGRYGWFKFGTWLSRAEMQAS
jgi:hypothetical protein